MPTADLDGPLADFFARTKQIRAIIASIEAAGRGHATIKTTRPDACLEMLSSQTSSTANAMSIVYLASSYEEFVRQEIEQCALYLVDRYKYLEEPLRHHVRNRYWQGCITRLSRQKKILSEKKQLDVAVLSDLKLVLGSTDGFVIGDDAATLLAPIYLQHPHNFRPHVVDEIAGRIGVYNLMDKAADSNKLRAHFGMTHKKDVYTKLVSSLNEFYETRNKIVHQLSNNAGYGVDAVVRYIELFEATGDSIKTVLGRSIARW